MNKTIYSTDADALEKLEARLEEQEKKYAEMKKLNKYFRENCTVKGYPGIDDEKAAKIDERISNAYSWCKAPYPQYEMQSMSQKIRATKERIKSLETEQTREETEYDTDGLGFDVVENKEIARLQIIYPGGGRVDNETYKRLRENGFVFSRTNALCGKEIYSKSTQYCGTNEHEKGNGGGDVMELKEFTVDDCLRTMYETPSDGAKSNEGKVCIIPLENLAEEYRRPECQLFRVSGGFGCIPGGIGRACYGRFCIDGERTMWPKGDFLGVANERVERIAEEMEAAWKDRTVEKNMEM